MHVAFDTAELTTLDKQVLALLAGSATPAPAPAPAVDRDVAVEFATPAAKPAPAKKAAAPKPEPEPEPEPEEDLVGDSAEPEPEGPTMADAVAAATKLVSSGGAPKVKEALAAVGAKRVSEIPADSIQAFLTALEA
jgi:hypothetical protein